MLGSLLKKFAGLKVCNLFKNRLQIFKNSFLIQHFWWLLLAVLLGTVESARVRFLWFCTSTCFWFWSKTFTKCFTNNSLLSCDKTISSLLELIGYVLSFRTCFRKTVNFDFDEKLAQSNVQITCNIMCQKTFFPCTLQLVRCFQFQGMIWKTETGSLILILFCFCLLCWLKNYLFLYIFIKLFLFYLYRSL